MRSQKLLLVLLALMLAASMSLFTGCGSDDAEETAPAEETETTEEAETVDEAAEIKAATDDYLSSEFSKTWAISAKDLNEKLFTEGEEGFQLIDIREPSGYAAGHIEGAINIPLANITDEASLSQIDPAKTQITIDYDGSQATGAHMFLTQMGYDVLFLKWGMSGWTTDPAIASADGSSPVWSGVGENYDLTTDAPEATGSFDAPEIGTGATTTEEAIINGAKVWANSGGGELIEAADLKTIVDSADPAYQIVSFRLAEHYAAGHIPGAINIQRGAMAKDESLAMLDPSKTIVIYCYQGHIAGSAQMFLTQLGYDTVSLHYGAGAWTEDRSTFGDIGTYTPTKSGEFDTVK